MCLILLKCMYIWVQVPREGEWFGGREFMSERSMKRHAARPCQLSTLPMEAFRMLISRSLSILISKTNGKYRIRGISVTVSEDSVIKKTFSSVKLLVLTVRRCWERPVSWELWRCRGNSLLRAVRFSIRSCESQHVRYKHTCTHTHYTLWDTNVNYLPFILVWLNLHQFCH